MTRKMDVCLLGDGTALLLQCTRRGGINLWDPFVGEKENFKNMKEFEAERKK